MFATSDSRQLVLGDVAMAEPSGGLNLHMFSSVLIGLSAPMIAIQLADPEVLRHGRVIVSLVLLSVFFISAILFAHSLLMPGDVRAVIFDPATRTATLFREGVFASNNLDVPFSLIRSLRLEQAHDGDGELKVRAVIVLATRDTIELPQGTTEGELVRIRQRTGLT